MRSTSDGEIHVFTFKEGLLSAVAHDLRLTLQRFELVNEAESLELYADAASLQVDGVVRAGSLDYATLDRSARSEIERTIRERVLRVDRHPRATFVAKLSPASDGLSVDGSLSLSGVTKPLSFTVKHDDGGYTGRVELHPSEWGIAPYRALLGAIKLQDRVVVSFRIPPLEQW